MSKRIVHYNLLHITNTGYNVFEVRGHGDKRKYIHYFPPLVGKITDDGTVPEWSRYYESPEDFPSFEAINKFWLSEDEYQGDDITYKGGSYGSNNLPQMNENWTVEEYKLLVDWFIIVIASTRGIIPRNLYKNGEDMSSLIIPGSEDTAQTIEFMLYNKVFIGYMADQPIKQYAKDCEVVYIDDSGIPYIRMAKRGKASKNVDIPNKIIPGAGETCENGCNTIKSEVRRALAEELQIKLENEEIISLGFIDENQDPRYNKFKLIEDGVLKEFGFDRGSRTDLYLVIFRGEKPTTVLDEFDADEISGIFWCSLDAAVAMSPSEFMIPKHHEIVLRVNQYLLDNQII